MEIKVTPPQEMITQRYTKAAAIRGKSQLPDQLPSPLPQIGETYIKLKETASTLATTESVTV